VRSADVYALVETEHGATPTSRKAGATPSVRPARLESADASGLAYPVDANEVLRLAAVERSGIVDSDAEPDFDDLARLAADVLKAPIALITLLTPNRQWFKSHIGLDMAETPRGMAFCNHTVLQDDVFQVEDLSNDERFAANPAVHGAPHFRFYAGAPLRDSEGFRLGSLCVLDMEPRRLDAAQEKILSVLASQVAAQIKLRSKDRELRNIGKKLEALAHS
jgi:GAF domain-containing protein